MPDQTRNLNSVTDFAGTLDSNDRIIMTDNKASLKALTTAILGKAMIEGYTESSLAGESRSVKSAIDSLNNNLVFDSNALSQSGKSTVEYLDSLKAGCIVQAHTWVKLSDMPSELTDGLMSVVFITDKGNRSYDYVIVNKNGDQWLAYPNGNTIGNRTLNWVKQPTRAEVDALNSKCENLLSFSGSSYNDLIAFCKANPWKFIFWTVSGSDPTNFPTNSNRHYGFATMNASGLYGTILCMSFNNSFYSKSIQGSEWSEWVSVI